MNKQTSNVPICWINHIIQIVFFVCVHGCHTNSKSKFQEIPGDFDNFFQEKLQQNILKSEWLPLKLCKLDSFSKKFSAPLNIILTTFTFEDYFQHKYSQVCIQRTITTKDLHYEEWNLNKYPQKEVYKRFCPTFKLLPHKVVDSKHITLKNNQRNVF